MSVQGPGDEIQQYMAEVRARVAARRQGAQNSGADYIGDDAEWRDTGAKWIRLHPNRQNQGDLRQCPTSDRKPRHRM